MGRCPLFRNYFKSLGWCYSLYLLLLLQYGTDRRSASVILLLFQYGAARRIASLVLLLLQYGKARRNASLVLLLLQYGADHTALPIWLHAHLGYVFRLFSFFNSVNTIPLFLSVPSSTLTFLGPIVWKMKFCKIQITANTNVSTTVVLPVRANCWK